MAAGPAPAGARLVVRPSAMTRPPGAEVVGESLPELFAFKRRIRHQFGSVPYVVEDEPAVCAWYPTAGRVVVWIFSEEARTLTLLQGCRYQSLRLGPLEAVSAAVRPSGTRL